ncbi:MAG: hypothetical protein C0514_02025 [Candidatus Puniceispirillum sp.]|nr:hypothetical protein [Candidatus Puniceispirillum sp.]
MHSITFSLLAALLVYPALACASADGLDASDAGERMPSSIASSSGQNADPDIGTQTFVWREATDAHTKHLNEFVWRANEAMDNGKYIQALDLIQKFINAGGAHDKHTHLITAVCAGMQNNHREAAYHYREYYSLEEDKENIDPNTYYNAACNYYSLSLSEKEKNAKNASKYMDCFLEAASQKRIALTAETHVVAAQVFSVNLEFRKAIDHWNAFFEKSEWKVDPFYYVTASSIFRLDGNLEEARNLLEKYYNSTPFEGRHLGGVFNLGDAYIALGDAEKAVRCYDEILGGGAAAQQRDLKSLSSTIFFNAALAYSQTNQRDKVEKIIALHNKLKPSARLLMTSRVTTKSSKVTKRPSPEAMTQTIKQHLKSDLTLRCQTLSKKIEKISFGTSEHFQTQARAHAHLMEALNVLIDNVQRLDINSSASGAASSSSTGSAFCDTTLLTAQRDLAAHERAYGSLEKKYQEACKIDRKEKSLAFLESLGHEAADLMPVVSTSNIRAQFGHAKLDTAHVSTVAAAPRLVVSSSSSDAQVLPEASFAPQVTFTMLRHVPGQLEKLRQISGHEKKYDMFMAQIAADPFGYGHKMGQFEALVGEKGLFSYRFDKGNRLTYRVTPTGAHEYHVTILSAFGHYKNLKTQLAQSYAQASSSQAASSSSHKTKAKPGGKNAKGGKKKRK